MDTSPQKSLRTRLNAFKSFFDSSDNFHFEGLYAKGGQGSIYRVKYTELKSGRPVCKRLVIKVADPIRGSDVEGLIQEKEILKDLRHCPHAVNIVEIPQDPLASSRHLGWEWMYLDEIENGTLTSFMERAKIQGLRSLPNRALWRIFLCMVRACIAIAWPTRFPTGHETTTVCFGVPTGLAHNDIHGGNFMLGSVIDAPEHDVFPILKLLDFGIARIIPHTHIGPNGTGEQHNIQDIGIMMASIFTLQTDSKYTGAEIEVDLSKLGYPSDTLSPAAGILGDPDNAEPDPLPHIDRDMRLIVAACMASEPQDRPSLADLEQWVYNEVNNTHPAYYGANPGGARWEENITISEILQECIFNAL
ncbi:kinase-like domain-containing protein [Daldinia bambusicola]|nr:kinase-like domain-containing protein [Daldinia bambusicola]